MFTFLYFCNCHSANMKKTLLSILSFTLLLACSCANSNSQIADSSMPLLHVSGEYVLTEAGDTFYIQGVNLGNWLNPEGYMFLMPDRECNSPRLLNDMFSQLVGPDETDAFWHEFKNRYITEADIRFIASTGANTIRLYHQSRSTFHCIYGCQHDPPAVSLRPAYRQRLPRLHNARGFCTPRFGCCMVPTLRLVCRAGYARLSGRSNG